MIPGERDALALHRKYGSSERVVKHCKTVTRVSDILVQAMLAKDSEVSQEATHAGALLHDIGRSRIQTVQHGLVGASMLEVEGVDSIVVEIVRRHVGAGIASEEARTLGFPDGDYIPRTIEQMVVCFSDKMVSADSVTPFENEVQRFTRKGHDVERLKRLKADVQESLRGDDPERIIFDSLVR